MVSLWLAICIGKDQDVKWQKRSSRLLGALCRETSGLWNESASLLPCGWEDFVHWERVSWGVERGCWKIGEVQWDFKENREWLMKRAWYKIRHQPRCPLASTSSCLWDLIQWDRMFIAYRVFDSWGWWRYSRGTQIGQGQSRTPKELKF